MPRTYPANETLSWKANTLRAARYSGGIRTLGSLASNLRTLGNSEQIHQRYLTRIGCVERSLGRLVVANYQMPQRTNRLTHSHASLAPDPSNRKGWNVLCRSISSDGVFQSLGLCSHFEN